MGGIIWKDKVVKFSLGKKSLGLNLRVVPFWYEGFGLMFTKKKTAKALLFGYSFSSRMTIFSSFIPYDFVAVWINSYDQIVGIRVVNPGESGVEPGIKFRKLIEIPIVDKYSEVVNFLLKNKKNGSKIKFVDDKMSSRLKFLL
ncbi:MAG: hypothetical protein PF542_03980 [Nanoarchaeota archaeon]|jgi:hypothetical protein|nr:hypothetical protein [Nanoarchaeota archaeon]